MRAFKILSAAAVALLLAAPQTAEARFGKRSNDSDRASRSSSKSSSKRSSKQSSDEHRAVRVDAPSSGNRGSPSRPSVVHPPRRGGPHYQRTYRHHHRPSQIHIHQSPVYGYTYVAPPPVTVVPAPMPAPEAAAVVTPSPEFSFGLASQIHAEGVALGLGLGIEGERWGVNGAFTGVFAEAERELDAIHIWDAHLTWSPLSGKRGRLRLEGGLSVAVAPDITFAGPDVGMSGKLRLLGPIGIEGAAHVTPFPYGRFDARAAATVQFGVLSFQAGWRTLVLDDRGQLGERHVDEFSGPFAALGLVL